MQHENDTMNLGAEGWMDPETRDKFMKRFETARDQVQNFVTHNPLAAVGAAMATGFLIARLFRR
jgi:ElaB/YqjD/DUF883 family membrane-anchored ribosome-binding protein